MGPSWTSCGAPQLTMPGWNHDAAKSTINIPVLAPASRRSRITRPSSQQDRTPQPVRPKINALGMALCYLKPSAQNLQRKLLGPFESWPRQGRTAGRCLPGTVTQALPAGLTALAGMRRGMMPQIAFKPDGNQSVTLTNHYSRRANSVSPSV